MQGKVLIIPVFLFFGFVYTASAELVVVGHRNLPTNLLTLAQVRALWLGDKVLVGRRELVAADLSAKDELREDFLSDVLDLTLYQYRVRTTKLAFTLQRPPPRVLPDQASVREWVGGNMARVGYLRPGMVDNTVKVLLRVTD